MDALPEFEEEIDGLVVKTRQFHVMRALPTWSKILRLVAPALGHLQALDESTVKEITAEGATLATVLIKIGPALEPILSALDGDVLAAIARELLVATVVTLPNGKRLELRGEDAAINAAFGGSLLTLGRACWFVGRVNFRSFSAAGGNGARPPAASPST